MDHANQKLENGLKSFYDRIRRPIDGLRLKRQLHRMIYSLLISDTAPHLGGKVVMQGISKPCTAIRFRLKPPLSGSSKEN